MLFLGKRLYRQAGAIARPAGNLLPCLVGRPAAKRAISPPALDPLRAQVAHLWILTALYMALCLKAFQRLNLVSLVNLYGPLVRNQGGRFDAAVHPRLL